MSRSTRPWARWWPIVAAVCLVASGAPAEEIATRPALPSALASQTLLLDATRAGKRVVAVGAWGHVVLSDDDGETWRQARSSPTSSVLTSVCFSDENNGWAVGHQGVVIRTRDGGEQWTLQRAEPDEETPLFSVWCESASTGTAVGAFGLALRTRDGGETWERVTIGTDGDDLHLNELFPSGERVRYIAAEIGTVYRSDDEGGSWKAMQTPYPGSFWGGLDPGDGTVIVFGLRGHVLRSADGGGTWAEIESGTDQSLGGGTVLPDGTIVLTGLGGAVVRSQDGGKTFTARTRPSRRGAQSVLAAGGKLLFFGEGGVDSWHWD